MKRAALRVAKQIATLLEGKGDTRHVPKEVLQEWFLTLNPPRKRKAPTKSSLERKANRATVKQLDDLFRELIRKRDGMRCRRCKKETQLQVAHIFSRRFHRLRWTSQNALLLCAGCHLFCHHHPIEGGKFFEETIGPREYLRLAALKSAYGKPPDHRFIKILLEKELRP